MKTGDDYAGELDWTPAATGKFLLQATAYRRGAIATSGVVRVCVIE